MMTRARLNDRKLLIELGVMLALKLALLYLIWHVFFSAAPDPLDAEAMANAFLNIRPEGTSP